MRGLGTEDVRRSERLAVDLGCTHAVAPVSGAWYKLCFYFLLSSPGVNSQKIFKKLDYTVLSSLQYSDFKNKKGEEFLTDTREHEEITFYKKLNV